MSDPARYGDGCDALDYRPRPAQCAALTRQGKGPRCSRPATTQVAVYAHEPAVWLCKAHARFRYLEAPGGLSRDA